MKHAVLIETLSGPHKDDFDIFKPERLAPRPPHAEPTPEFYASKAWHDIVTPCKQVGHGMYYDNRIRTYQLTVVDRLDNGEFVEIKCKDVALNVNYLITYLKW